MLVTLWHALSARLAAALILLLLCLPAQAGAFLQGENKGLAILTFGMGQNDYLAFGRNGRPILAPAISKREAQLYAEYGLSHWLTGIVKISGISRKVDGPAFAQYRGLDYLEFGGRVALWRSGPFAVSTQLTLRAPGANNAHHPAQAGNTGLDIDLRLQAGASFSLWNWPVFACADIGYRERTGPSPSEWRGELTLGVRPREKWLWLMQAFSVSSPRALRTGFPAMREHKLQTSLVYDLNKHWALQVGSNVVVAGRNTPRDVGGFFAIWRRF